MSDIELSSDSDESESREERSSEDNDSQEDNSSLDSSEDLSAYEEKKTKKYDGVPDVSSSEETTTESPSESVAKPSDRGSMGHRSRGLKSLKQKLKEKAFKKAELAGNDPALISHRMERRALADRLEEDSEFREHYIQEQEDARQAAIDEEDESFASDMNFSNTSELIDQVNRLQARRRGDNISHSSYDVSSRYNDSDDEDATPDESSIYTYPSSMVDDDDLRSRSRKSRKSRAVQQKTETYTPTRTAPEKAGIYIHIENLTLNL
jgi:hypothetical protein